MLEFRFLSLPRWWQNSPECIDPGGHKGARPDQIPLAAATWLVAAPCGGCIVAPELVFNKVMSVATSLGFLGSQLSPSSEPDSIQGCGPGVRLRFLENTETG